MLQCKVMFHEDNAIPYCCRMGGALSAWKEDLISGCDYVMDEKIVKMPEVLQDERFLQWSLYERWRQKRKGTAKFVRMQCPLASVQHFTKAGQEVSGRARAIDFAIFAHHKDNPKDENTVAEVCVELKLAKTKSESSTRFRECCLKDIFRLGYLRHQQKTQKAYFVMFGTENQLFQVTEALKALKGKENKMKWKDLEETGALEELKRSLNCTCEACERVEMSCLRSVVPKLKLVHERVVMHKAYWCKIWEVDAPVKR